MDGLTAPTPNPHLEDLPGTFAILTTVSVLASFTSTWDKLEAFEKREPKLRKCLWARLPFILFTDDWCRWAHRQGMVPLWAGGPRYYKISSWTNLEEQASEDSLCINSCLHVPALSLSRWQTTSCKVKWTFASPNWLWYFIMAIEISWYSPSGSSLNCGLFLLSFLLFSIWRVL